MQLELIDRFSVRIPHTSDTHKIVELTTRDGSNRRLYFRAPIFVNILANVQLML